MNYSIKSIDNNIVELSDNKLIGKSEGTANITFDVDYNGLISTKAKLSCNVTVIKPSKVEKTNTFILDALAVNTTNELDLSMIEGDITSIKNNTPDVISIDGNNNITTNQTGFAEILVTSETDTTIYLSTLVFAIGDEQSMQPPSGISGIDRKITNLYMLVGDETTLDFNKFIGNQKTEYENISNDNIDCIFDEKTGKATIKAKKESVTTFNVTTGNKTTFDNGTFSAWYDAHEITIYVLDPTIMADMNMLYVEYNEDLPDDFTPSYSIDNENWTTSSEIPGIFNEDGTLYIKFAENSYEKERISTKEYDAYVGTAVSGIMYIDIPVYIGVGHEVNFDIDKVVGNDNKVYDVDDSNIATCTCGLNTGKIKIKGESKGNTKYCVKLGNSSSDEFGNYNASYIQYIFDIYVFNPIITTKKDKINIDCGDIPENLKIEYSTDKKEWTTSTVLDRNLDNDATIYIKYTADDCLSAGIEEYKFDISAISGCSLMPIEETIPIGSIYAITGMDGLSKYTISDEDIISFDSKKMTVTPKKAGTSVLTLEYKHGPSFMENGCLSYFTSYIEYTFTVKDIEPTYTVSFDSNGGYDSIGDITVKCGETIKIPTVKNTGYKFLGWFDENGNKLTSSTKIIKNTKFIAKWEKIKCIISFDSAGGSKVNSVTLDYNTQITSLPIPIKYGYTFKYWMCDGRIIDTYYIVTKDMNLKAVYQPNYCDLEYRLKGGVNNKKNPVLAEFDSTVKLYNPTRKGYIFKGWYINNKKVTSFKTDGDKIITAKWEKIKKTSAKMSVKKSKNKITVKIKDKKINGIQIQISTSKSFKNAKTYTIKGSSKTVSVSKNKKYYIRARYYKIDSTNKKVYGKWSKTIQK
jgi:uncharacterized repeat protein (TIGR02543 family)